jgi:hypothetical protein
LVAACFLIAMDSHAPQIPRGAHVWVSNHGSYGDPVPGVVVCWQHSPVHTVTTSEWVALVVGAPFGTAMTLSWVGAERLLPIRDDTPVDDPR